MNFEWTNIWELALLLIGACAGWAFFNFGWYRLDRAPRRMQAFSPLVGGAIMIAMIVAGQAGALMAAGAFEVQRTAEQGLSLRELAIVASGSYLAQGIVLIAYVHLLNRARRPLNDQRMKPLSALAMGVGALALFWPILMAVSWIATRITMMVTGEPVDVLAHDTLSLIVGSEADLWMVLMIALAVVAAPVMEEVLYRGVLQETLVQLGMGRWTAIVVASLIFAIMHIEVVPPHALVSLFVLSLGFGWVYEKTGRLAAPIVMHVLFNAGNIAMALAVH